MLLVFYAAMLSAGCRSTFRSTPQDIEVHRARRNDLVLSSQVFQGINNPSEKTEIEIKNGPFPDGANKGKNYFEWGDELTCNFSDLNFTKPLGGMSPKFICDLVNKDGKVVAKDVSRAAVAASHP
jgi:hypothetical protein